MVLVLVYVSLFAYLLCVWWLIYAAWGWTRASWRDPSQRDFTWRRVVWASCACGLSAGTAMTLLFSSEDWPTMSVPAALVMWVGLMAFVTCVAFVSGVMMRGLAKRGLRRLLRRRATASSNPGSAV